MARAARSPRRIFLAAVMAAALLLPWLGTSEYVMHVAIMTLIYALFASSLNVILMTGQMSIAHAAFYGIGAYTSTILVKEYSVSFWIALPCAMLAAMAFGYFIGRVSLRLKTHYFAICTFAFGELVMLVMDNWTEVTNGAEGIRAIPGIDPLFGITFEGRTSVYYLVLALVVLATILFARLRRSRVGRAFASIHENDEFARAIGIDIMRYKLYAFLIGTAAAGAAGSLYAHYIKFISPTAFSVMESINLLVVLLIGGIGFIAGPIVGAAFNQLIPEALHVVSEYRMIAYGVITVLFIIYLPYGIVGWVSRRFPALLATGEREPEPQTEAIPAPRAQEND